jgi:molecular chaperone GrpE
MEPNLESVVPTAGNDAANEASVTAPPAAQDEALAAKAQEAERLQERLVRLQAEFENYKKRMAREKAEFLKFATEGLLLEFLPILDNLERAIASARAEAANREAVVAGIDMIARLFRATLEKAGVKPMEAVGKPFDPSLYQAVAQVESPDGQDNVVVEEIQKGYLLEGRVLRAAMVKVSRTSSPKAERGLADEDTGA